MNVNWSIQVPKFGRRDQLAVWLQLQLDKCNDESFGKRFAELCPISGVDDAAYRHRVLETAGEKLLTGIRFKGGDVNQPFVDLIAWTGEPADAWLSAVASEFKAFRPRFVRVCWPGVEQPPWSGEVDQFVYAGPARGATHPGITRALDLNWFDEFRRMFQEWRDVSPLGPEVTPAGEEQLQSCLDEGRVVVARDEGRLLGVAAGLPESERSLHGWMMMEEFVVPKARGQGLGAALQRSFMNEVPQGELVWGTIHGLNVPSQITARRCGRVVVETWWFIHLAK